LTFSQSKTTMNVTQQMAAREEAKETVIELMERVSHSSPLLNPNHWYTLSNDKNLTLEQQQWCQCMGDALHDLYEKSEEMSSEEYSLDSDEEEQMERMSAMYMLAHKNGGDFDATGWLEAQDNEGNDPKEEYWHQSNRDDEEHCRQSTRDDEEYWRQRDQEDEEYWNQERDMDSDDVAFLNQEFYMYNGDHFMNQGFHMDDDDEVSQDKSIVNDIGGDDLCQ